MPRTLFDQTLVPRERNRRSFGTVTLSVMLHAAALVAVLALQFTSSMQELLVASPLPAFVVERPAPPPPAITPPTQPVRPVTRPAPTLTAPTSANDHIPTEPESPTPPAGPPAPIGPVLGTPGGLDTIIGPPGSRVSLMRPPPPPQHTGPVRIGGTIAVPTRVVYVPPVYPSIAQTARVEGEVALEATIDENGVVRNVVVTHSVPLLDRAAIDAVARWRYSPTLLNGQPVAVIMLVRVKFTLK